MCSGGGQDRQRHAGALAPAVLRQPPPEVVLRGEDVTVSVFACVVYSGVSIFQYSCTTFLKEESSVFFLPSFKILTFALSWCWRRKPPAGRHLLFKSGRCWTIQNKLHNFYILTFFKKFIYLCAPTKSASYTPGEAA